MDHAQLLDGDRGLGSFPQLCPHILVEVTSS
jgi:hypothetical protein